MTETLLRIENLKTYFFTDEGVVKAVDDVSLVNHAGRDAGVGGRIGLRQERHRDVDHPADFPAGAHRRRPDHAFAKVGVRLN